MNFIIWLVIGGIIGWLASMVMKTDAQQGVVLNVVVGIVGAMLGGWLISPLVGVPTINQDAFSLRRCSCRSSARSSCWPSSTCSAAAAHVDPEVSRSPAAHLLPLRRTLMANDSINRPTTGTTANRDPLTGTPGHTRSAPRRVRSPAASPPARRSARSPARSAPRSARRSAPSSAVSPARESPSRSTRPAKTRIGARTSARVRTRAARPTTTTARPTATASTRTRSTPAASSRTSNPTSAATGTTSRASRP